MSKNRYGRIHHSNHHHINLRFPSADARDEFAVKFQTYHDGHDHDGEAPRFEEITAQQAGSTNYESGKLHDAHSVTIDGYASYEIEEYHEDKKHTNYYRYKPPTCCVAPLISINRKLVDSVALDRHELSAIFGDMPDEDYAALLVSVETDGFIDNVVRIYEGQILDGWHRYRAANELNLLRKLRFKQWHEDEHRDGDPRVFVYGRNQHRRHYSAAQRAQVAVAFNERFGHGGDRKSDESKHQNGVLKTKKELAKEANVGTSTINRAIQIEKEGKSEAVISGETTAGEVIKARDAATAKKRKKQTLKNMWDTRIQAARDYTGDGDTELNQYLTLPDLEKGFAKSNESYAEAFVSGMKRIDAATSFKDFEDRAFDVDEFGNAKVDRSELEVEYRAIHTYAGDIRQWERPDWSPDTNWILPLIEAKKAKAKTPKPDPDDLKRLEEDRNKAQEACIEMWKAFEKSELSTYLDKDDFMEVAAKQYQCSPNFPDPRGMKRPEIWVTLFNAMKLSLERTSEWVQELLDEFSQDDDAGPPEETVESLWEKITPAISVWKSARKGQGVGHASKTMFITAVKCFDSELSRDSETDVLLLKKLLDLLTEVRGPCHTFERYIKMQVDGASIWDESEASDDTGNTDAGSPQEATDLGDEIQRLRSEIKEYLPTWQQDTPGTEDATLFVLLDARFRLFHDGVHRGTSPFFAEELAPLLALMKGNDLCLADKVREMLGTGSGLSSVADEETDEPDLEDTSLAEIDNLPAVRYFLEMLEKQVQTFVHQTDKDNFSCAIYDMFLSDGDVYLTERQQLAILIDVAHTLVSESESL